MSNLIKSIYFNVQQEGKRVIDSDSHIKDFLPELKLGDEQDFIPLSLGIESLQDAADGYMSGLEDIKDDTQNMQEAAMPSEEERQAALQLIEDAKKEAEAILQEAREHTEEIKNQAYEEGRELGYANGMAAAKEEMEEKEQELVRKEAQMVKDYQQQLESLEPAFVDVMAKLIQKVTGILAEDKKDILLYLIERSIRQLEKPKSILLRVAKEDMVIVASHIEQLKAAVAEGVEFDVVEEMTLTKNQCIIETDQKMFDCSLDAQIENLTEQLKLLTLAV